ncbi:MAG: hypothetical protein HQM13_08460 [SAR324 cluster bacterium]|nr:hypothetical protein [SAR324 cluster bacterium]
MIDALIAAILPSFDESPAMSQYAEGAYWEQIRDLGIPLERILRTTVGNYRNASPLFEDSKGDAKRQMEKVLLLLPSFLFSIAAQLSKDKQNLPLAKELALAGTVHFLHHEKPGNEAAECFMQTLNLNDSTSELSEKLRNAENNYLPRLILGDFYLIRKFLHFPKTSSKHEMIERQFLNSGLLLIFLKYYFELLNLAPNDEIAEHVETIFLRLLVSLKRQEKRVWSGVSNRMILEVQVEHAIEQNKAPFFFKDRFSLMKSYFPSVRARNDSKSPLYHKQLQKWQGFSISKLILFANMINTCKGPRHLKHLLVQLHRLNPDQFFALADHLTLAEARKKHNDLFLLMMSLPPMKKRNAGMRSRKDKLPVPQDPNHYPEVQSWGPFLKKFHDRIHMSGMISEEELPTFFKKFAESALGMLQEKEITAETLSKFKNTLNGLMQECLERSSLNGKEVRIYQNQIDREMEGVEDADFDERAQKIDSIGLVLCEASKKQQEYEQLYRDALPIELTLSEEEKRVQFTIEKLLLLPLPNRQKERILESYVPSLISDMMMMAIYNMNLTNPDGAEVSDSVFDLGKSAKLRTGKLIHLLEQAKGFESLAEKRLVPLRFENDEFKISVREFFLFPLSPDQKNSKSEIFPQHLRYLRMLTNRNAFPLYLFEIILNNLVFFPLVNYKQSFDIFEEGELNETKLEDLVGIWKREGWDKWRV